MARRQSRSSKFGRSRKGEQTTAPTTPIPSVNDIETANKIQENFRPANQRQRQHLRNLRNYQLTIALGPAGTGKTEVFCYFAASGILTGSLKKIVLMRPPRALEDTAHETLPGGLFDKVAPWARPALKKLKKYLGDARMKKMLRDNDIEVLPFTYLRGDEFEDGTFVLLDEAQNCTYAQMKAFTTRIADGAIIGIAGDVSQTDMDEECGLAILHEVVDGSLDIEVGIVEYQKSDIMRGKLCSQFVNAWDVFEKGIIQEQLQEVDLEDDETGDYVTTVTVAQIH